MTSKRRRRLIISMQRGRTKMYHLLLPECLDLVHRTYMDLDLDSERREGLSCRLRLRQQGTKMDFRFWTTGRMKTCPRWTRAGDKFFLFSKEKELTKKQLQQHAISDRRDARLISFTGAETSWRSVRIRSWKCGTWRTSWLSIRTTSWRNGRGVHEVWRIINCCVKHVWSF